MRNRLARLSGALVAGVALVAAPSCAHKKNAEEEGDVEVASEAEIDPDVVENYFETSLVNRAKKLDFATPVSRDDFMTVMEVGDPIGTLKSRGQIIDYWQIDDYTIEATVAGRSRAVSGVSILKKSDVIYEDKYQEPEVVDLAEPELPRGSIPELPSQPVMNRFMRTRSGPLPAVGESPPPVTIIRNPDGSSRVVSGNPATRDLAGEQPRGTASSSGSSADPFKRHLLKKKTTEGGSGNR